HRVTRWAGMFVGEHRKPFLVDGFFEGFILGPDNDLNNVIDRAAGGFHDSPDILEHKVALAFDIRWRFTGDWLHTENPAGHHERSDDASHRDRVFVMQSRHFKTAAFAHYSVLLGDVSIANLNWPIGSGYYLLHSLQFTFVKLLKEFIADPEM